MDWETETVTTTLRIMTVGDSITAGRTSEGSGCWQDELARLCSAYAGVCLDVRNLAVAGTRTTYWPSRIKALLGQHQPDLVTFFTGTNDDVAEMCFGEPATSWAWRSTVEAIHAYRTPPTLIVPALIQYSDPLIAPQWLLDSQPITNDRIYREWSRYNNTPGWFAGVCDFQRIPATADYLDDGGIHPTARGYRAMGRIVYDAIQAAMGWPACQEPPLSGMYGHRRGYPRPPYIPGRVS